MNFIPYLKAAKKVILDPNPSGNAVLEFETAGNISIEFDNYGNAQTVTEKVPVSLTAWLHQAKPPDREVQDGLNQGRYYYEGELVEPKTYDLPLRPESDIKITINGRVGKFYPVELFDSPASLQYSIRLFLGQKIAGWAEIEEGN